MRYQTKGRFLLASFLIGVLVACAPATPAPQPTAPPPAAQPTTPPAAEPTTPPAAEPTQAPQTKGKIKIATQSPLSGPQAALGVGIRNGAELGLRDMGKMLTDMGFEVELAPFDDQAKPEVGAANAKSIASDPDILCVVGHLNSGVALASLPTYSDNNLAMVSPANTNPKITESGYKNAFRVVGRDDVQGPVGEEFARTELKVKSIYIIHDKTDYGQGVAEFFRQQAEKNGITVVGFEGTEEQANFESILTPILAANPDLIYFGGIYSQAGPFLRQARDRGITAIFLGPDGLDDPEMAKLAGDAVKGMYYTSVSAPVEAIPDAAKFAEDYKAKYNITAPTFSAQAYDAAGICIRAIMQAAEKAGGAKPTRAAVVEAIRSLGEYKGIAGTYVFNEKGDQVKAQYYVYKVGDENIDPVELWDKRKVEKVIELPAP